jgi:sucrose phosphorylase
MPNHISPQSEPFRDFLQNGEASRYKNMFVHWEDIWPEGMSQKAVLKL